MQQAIATTLTLALLAGCDVSGNLPPRFRQAPVIVSFEVLVNGQTPRQGPFGVLAQTSGQGPLTFVWDASGGVLSVGTQSATASAGFVPAFTAWQPPTWPGTYEVTLTVTDASGSATLRRARFEVEERTTRVWEPLPCRTVTGDAAVGL